MSRVVVLHQGGLVRVHPDVELVHPKLGCLIVSIVDNDKVHGHHRCQVYHDQVSGDSASSMVASVLKP